MQKYYGYNKDLLIFYTKTSKPYLKSVVFKVRHDDNYVIFVPNAGLDSNDIGLTTVHCKTIKQLK